jgi:predicted nucleotidyltransferase component of viral defense system
LHKIPDKRYFQAKSSETKFKAPELEKLYRIMLILSEINRGELNRYLALRGGTAINLCYEELPRLSIDIDLAAITNGNKEKMLNDREVVRKQLIAILNGAGYQIDSHLDDYALDRFELRYRNAFDSPDRMKVEINYISSRIPIYGITNGKPHNIFDISLERVQMLSLAETYGSKIEALIKRHAVRDLFDVYLLTEHREKKMIDISKLRKCTIFSCCVEIAWDFRKSLASNPADAITEKQVRYELQPYLRYDYNFNLNFVKKIVGRFCNELFRLESEEQKFLQSFYTDKEYLLKLLFPKEDHLTDHPGIKWRLQQMDRST